MTTVIEKIFCHVAEISLGFSYSTGTVPKTRSLIWEVVAGKHTGLGENFFQDFHLGRSEWTGPGISPGKEGLKDNLESWVRPIVGRRFDLLDGLLPELPEKTYHGLPFPALEGLSIALYDLAGRAYGIPVHVLLGGKGRDRMPGMPVVHVAEPDVMAKRARAWREAGYRYLKIKLRGSLEEDLAALRRIRETIGDDVPLQADANVGYKNPELARKAIETLKPFRIDFFEDMLDGSLEQIADLRLRTGAKIMVDGQAYWPNVYKVCRLGAADIINHHPNNQGGLAAALRIDSVALSAGIPTAVGSSGAFDIQNSAFQMLGSVIGLTRPCEEIGLVPYYSGPTKGEYDFDREPSVIKKSYPIDNGVICVSDAPGLGIELDRKKLESVTVESIVFE